MKSLPYRILCSLTWLGTWACSSVEQEHASEPSEPGLTDEPHAAPSETASPTTAAPQPGPSPTGAAPTVPTGAQPNPTAAPSLPANPDVTPTNPTAAPTDGGPSDGAAPTDEMEAPEHPLEDPSADLFDPTRLPRFDIHLPPESIEALDRVTSQDDPEQDVYVTAQLEHDGETVGDIGIRFKGEGSFQRLDRKPAWKIKFDAFVEGQSFRGLKRLALNNLFEDPSFIAERLAYDVYRAAGIPAPRCNNALVYVNGTFYGVYANVEAEDKTFLRRWFRDVGGNLYEEGQSDFVPGAATAFDLETNESRNDRSDLEGLIEAVQGATDPATFLEDLGRYIDTSNYLRFTAVEAAVNQWDMYSYTVFWVNNMRLYNDPLTGKFHFIPWGHDLSMKPYRDSGRPFIRLFELARQYDRRNGPVTSGILFQRCMQSAPCVAAYRAAVEEVIQVYESSELESRAESYYEQIKAAVYEDTRKNICCDSPPALTNSAFEAGYQAVLQTIRGRVAALREDLQSGP